MFTHNNGHIHFETDGSGEAIVFIHGFSLDHTTWKPQVDFFKHKYQVITYDARGFGKSSLPDGSYKHTDDLYALLKHLGIKKVHLVGLSMGGRIATNFTLEHPDMVITLTLMDSSLDGYESEVDWNVHAKEEGLEKAKHNWLKHELFASTQNPDVVTALKTIVQGYTGWHWLSQELETPTKTPARDNLSEITQPTLILVGENDLKYFHNIAKVLEAGIPNSIVKIIPNVGHMINMEAPNEVNSQIADFIDKS